MTNLTNYLAYLDPATGHPRLGHLDLDNATVQPLAFASGQPLDNLYQAIQVGEDGIVTFGSSLPLSSVKLLPPVSGRDVLAVGKNYMEHAQEFHKSGYDSSDKVALPSHPVIFTKRATSIVPHGHPVFLDPKFTQTLDYEGELGVIIGKPGLGVKAADAMDYVWGYTIINDITARERQRDHKQFFIGKSGNTDCPMGPIAVPAKYLPKVLTVQTFVNGEKRQRATTDDLIFSIPALIEALSEGFTLQPGDVIATGTPAGVGIGKTPPVFLQPNDEVRVSITGLGCLQNKIVLGGTDQPSPATIPADLKFPESNISRAISSEYLTQVNRKPLNYKQQGAQHGVPIVFIHGLGGTMDFFTPLISSLKLGELHPLHLLDLEGHGLSPTSPLSRITIQSYAEDIKGVFDIAGISASSKPIVIAHSMGCQIALRFALLYPGLIDKLVLLGPPPNSNPTAVVDAFVGRAPLVREKGMSAVVDAVVAAGVSEKTKSHSPLAATAVRLSLLGTEPEGYAKACTAIAGVGEMDLSAITCNTLIVTGEEDKVGPPAVCEKYAKTLPNCRDPVVLEGVGHWHVFEDLAGVSVAIKNFL
ncbi:hypothetical protein BO71DRAFT_488604 [Aspergillus ellipticus CBS 707.79]|uniref:Fumarylacetoacetate hydrolase n=1 Tax=Aspergillus ellipticus CBS 707.79 TaxID=1448320 RepID=A0A319D289_9EURO|nr:hypothetical protein BO71DRAFT_488604 [Aspergillus ellipticus CBS 707.79]